MAEPGPSESSHTSRERSLEHCGDREERVKYIKSLGILKPEEKTLLHFLEDALAGAPLPKPWTMHHDSTGRMFFVNKVSSTSTWKHPLEPSVKELVVVWRMCLAADGDAREATISRLSKQWEEEAKRDISHWYGVKHESGKEYYCHRDTGESMWTHPAEVVMPLHYIKIQAMERLRDEKYRTMLLENSKDAIYNMTPSARQQGKLLSPQISFQGDEDARIQLEAQVKSLASSNAQLKEKLMNAERDLLKAREQAQSQARAPQVQSTSADQRLAQMQLELEAERRQGAQQQQERSELLAQCAKANRDAAEYRRAKSTLEVTLAALQGDTSLKNSILATQQPEDLIALEDIFSTTATRREEILGLDSIGQDLEEKLRQSTEAQRLLRSELEAAQQTARSASTLRDDRTCQEVSLLKAQLEQTMLIQNSLRERLLEAENELRARSDSLEKLQVAEAQLAENRVKYEQIFQSMQAMEREKVIYEAKLAMLQTRADQKDDTQLDNGSGAVAKLTMDLAEASAAGAAAKRENDALRRELQAATAGSAGQLVAALETALADEKLRNKNLELQLNEAAGRADACAALSVANRHAEELQAARERAVKAEKKLAKKELYFEECMRCVQDAEDVKRALETRLNAMEKKFQEQMQR